jgi:hypothetical protein
MNSDLSGKPERPGETQPHDGVQLPITEQTSSAVPVFSCIVYVSPAAKGGVQARVANLPGLTCSAASERDALAQLVPAFKQRVGELTQNKTPIPWIDPPSPIEPDEQKRFIPIHL